jgi:hypothetical protein
MRDFMVTHAHYVDMGRGESMSHSHEHVASTTGTSADAFAALPGRRS